MPVTYHPVRFNKFTKTFDKLPPVPCKILEYIEPNKVKIKVLCWFDNQPNPTLTVESDYIKTQKEPITLINYYEPCQKI
jgi:hypothetical protein